MYGINCQATLLRQLPSTCSRTNWMITGMMWGLKAEAYQPVYTQVTSKQVPVV